MYFTELHNFTIGYFPKKIENILTFFMKKKIQVLPTEESNLFSVSFWENWEFSWSEFTYATHWKNASMIFKFLYEATALIYSGYQWHATYRLQKTPIKLRLVDVNQRKAVEIVLNSKNISREQNEEIDSFIHLRMVNFMKVDFQDRLSKKMRIV